MDLLKNSSHNQHGLICFMRSVEILGASTKLTLKSALEDICYTSLRTNEYVESVIYRQSVLMPLTVMIILERASSTFNKIKIKFMCRPGGGGVPCWLVRTINFSFKFNEHQTWYAYIACNRTKCIENHNSALGIYRVIVHLLFLLEMVITPSFLVSFAIF